MHIELDYLGTCLCCGSPDLMQYMDLGEQPPCNALVSDQAAVSPLLPLKVNVCQNCWHSQLGWVPTDMSILWKDYPYRTGVSETLCNHYYKLADKILKLNKSAKKVLDIGCNDCTLLSSFKWIEPGIQTYGLDPFPVETETPPDQFFQMLFNAEAVKDFCLNNSGPYDIITATNVLAHNKNPKEFITAASQILSPDGLVVLEFPYGREMINGRQFDTIYHEHVSYFNISSIIKLLEGTSLFVYRIEKTGTHGGSLTLFLKKCLPGMESKLHCLRFNNLAEREQSIKSLAAYTQFAKAVSLIPHQMMNVKGIAIARNLKIIGFGASGKSSVFLNYTGFEVEYIIDETPAKQGKFTPGCKHFPIRSMAHLAEEQSNLMIVIFAWNCFDECMRKLRSVRWRKNDMAAIYVPYVSYHQLQEFPVETGKER